MAGIYTIADRLSTVAESIERLVSKDEEAESGNEQ